MLDARRELGKLIVRFPRFEFRLIRGPNGRPCFEAVRASGPHDSGLYVLISGNATEIAEELAADELRDVA